MSISISFPSRSANISRPISFGRLSNSRIFVFKNDDRTILDQYVQPSPRLLLPRICQISTLSNRPGMGIPYAHPRSRVVGTRKLAISPAWPFCSGCVFYFFFLSMHLSVFRRWRQDRRLYLVYVYRRRHNLPHPILGTRIWGVTPISCVPSLGLSNGYLLVADAHAYRP